MKPIEEVETSYRSVFTGYEHFNSIQSQIFNDVYHSNKSIIVSAPTGSGKTAIFELAIIRLLLHDYNDFKIIYVAPIKALCAERFNDWQSKFSRFGISCLEVTGDSEIQDFSELINAKLIITTPEKWDSLTRKWRDNEEIVASVKLFMVDEVHLLNEDIRGPILEAIVSRMKTIQFAMTNVGNEMKLRFVCASATIPNVIDISEWIKGKDNKTETVHYFFNENQRPVKLEKHILGYNTFAPSFKFDLSLNYKLIDVIKRYSNGKPTLIFCSSRKSVEMAAAVLQKESYLFRISDIKKTILVEIAKNATDQKLHNLISKGIGYHHAGLTFEDRNLIENAFRKGLIPVLVSTNTLAMGVNLPAHLVIIKSTETFINGKVIEYSKSAVLQMIGRAGRPQYDVNGVAVIMTQQKYVKKYENLMNGCNPIESHLHKHLTEHLNSEIVLQTITDIDVAMEWMRSTFLYVRACKTPINYGLTSGISKEKIEKKLEEMCLVQINNLESNDLITKDQAYGLSIKATPFGRLMARYYLSFETMKMFRNIRGNENYLEMFYTIIRCKEFSEYTLRVNEKKILNELNDSPVRFPIKGKIKTNENKIACLIQANFGNMVIQDPSMRQESLKMMRAGERISNCLIEYINISEKRLRVNGSFKALLNIIIISKCYRAKLWENSKFICKQLKKIGNTYSSLLVKAGKTTVESILETDSRTLEMILNKPPPFGSEILEALSTFPDYNLKMEINSNNMIKVSVNQVNQSYNCRNYNSYLIVGDTGNKLLLYCNQVDTIIKENGIFIRIVQIPNMTVHAIHAHLIHSDLVGSDKTVSIILNYNNEEETEIQKPTKRKIQTTIDFPKTNKKEKRQIPEGINNFEEISNEYNSMFIDDYENLLSSVISQEVIRDPDSRNLSMTSQIGGNSSTSSITHEIAASQISSYYTKNCNKPTKRSFSSFQYKTPKALKKSETSTLTDELSSDENYEQAFSSHLKKNQELPSPMKFKENACRSDRYSGYQIFGLTNSPSKLSQVNGKSKLLLSGNFTPLANQSKVLSHYQNLSNKINDNYNSSKTISFPNFTNKLVEPKLCKTSTITHFDRARIAIDNSGKPNLEEIFDLTKNCAVLNTVNTFNSDKAIDLMVREIAPQSSIAVEAATSPKTFQQIEPYDFSYKKLSQSQVENINIPHTQSIQTYLNSNLADSPQDIRASNQNILGKRKLEDLTQKRSKSIITATNTRDYESKNIYGRTLKLNKHRQSDKFINTNVELNDFNQAYYDDLMNDDEIFENICTQKAIKQQQKIYPSTQKKSSINREKRTCSVADLYLDKLINHFDNIDDSDDKLFTNSEALVSDKNVPQTFDPLAFKAYSNFKAVKTFDLTDNYFKHKSSYQNKESEVKSCLEKLSFDKFTKKDSTELCELSLLSPKNFNNKEYQLQRNSGSFSYSLNKNRKLGVGKTRKSVANIAKPNNLFKYTANPSPVFQSMKNDFMSARKYYKELKDGNELNLRKDNVNESSKSVEKDDIENFFADDEDTDQMLFQCSEELFSTTENAEFEKCTKNAYETATLTSDKKKVLNHCLEVPKNKFMETSNCNNVLIEGITSDCENSLNIGVKTVNTGSLCLITKSDCNKTDVRDDDLKIGKFSTNFRFNKIGSVNIVFDVLNKICDGERYENQVVPEMIGQDSDSDADEFFCNTIGHTDFFLEESHLNNKKHLRLPDIPDNQIMTVVENRQKDPLRILQNKNKIDQRSLNNKTSSKQKSFCDEILKTYTNKPSEHNRYDAFLKYESKPKSKIKVAASNKKLLLPIRNESRSNSNKILIDSSSERDTTLNKLKARFDQDSSYHEEIFMKDLARCLISDRAQYSFQDECSKKNDDSDKIDQNFLERLESLKNDLNERTSIDDNIVVENLSCDLENDDNNDSKDFDITEEEYYDDVCGGLSQSNSFIEKNDDISSQFCF